MFYVEDFFLYVKVLNKDGLTFKNGTFTPLRLAVNIEHRT